MEGLYIEAYQANSESRQLNPCMESSQIPCVIDEVASPQEVEDIAGFEGLAGNFHKKSGWKTLLMLGRDNLWVHDTKKRHTAGSGTDQMAAVSTPLGWALLGPSRYHNRSLGMVG